MCMYAKSIYIGHLFKESIYLGIIPREMFQYFIILSQVTEDIVELLRWQESPQKTNIEVMPYLMNGNVRITISNSSNWYILT